MATYPVNQGGIGSRIDVQPDAGIRKTLMANGAERAFTDYDEDRFDLVITHFWLDQSDRDAIEAFYLSGKTTTHTVVTELEGTYECTFSNRPRLDAKSGPYANVIVEMSGVKTA